MPRHWRWTLGAPLLLLACTAAPAVFRQATPLGLDAFVLSPADNPLTARKVALGERLFFDRIMSSDRSLSCASCHMPEHAFSDTVAFSRGAGGRVGRRNTPTLLNRAYGSAHFWDGRATTLEEQVLLPIADPLELGLPVGELVARLERDRRYRRGFARAFGDGVTRDNTARALAAYLRTLRTGDSPLDRWRAGDTAALTPSARRGLELFQRKANCTACHAGPNFTDEAFHNTGVAWRSGAPSDSGRYLVSRLTHDIGAFKTPTLRVIACTAPYMHDGSIRTLEDVVEFYDQGGIGNPLLDSEIRPLRLDLQEKRDLVQLLRSLGDDCASAARPSPR